MLSKLVALPAILILKSDCLQTFPNGFLTVYMHNTKNPMQTFTHKTTKSEPEAHGYGLSIIEDICQKYNGSYQWIDHNNTFDSIVLLQIKNL